MRRAWAKLSYARSVATGRPFDPAALDALVEAELARRTGATAAGQGERATGSALSGPALTGAARAALQLARFRQQARLGATETAYYGRLFDARGVDPKALTWADIEALPYTPKSALQADPGAFVRQGSAPAFRTTTTGTTGRPTTVYFSRREIASTVALNALTYLQSGRIAPMDVVMVGTSSRATLGNNCYTRAVERIGAVWFQAGLIEPALSLALLKDAQAVTGKHPRPTVYNTYASYLGMLVTRGTADGDGPADFGLRELRIGGEIVTQGLKARLRALFGDVRIHEGFGMTEIWPLGGHVCEQGHLHWNPGHGLVEVRALDADRAAMPGELGTLVGTPFAPYRDATVVLRYDTEDVVRALDPNLTCRLHHQPATSQIQGKLRLCARHAGGWTTPRNVLEALESVAAVPLPARFALRADDTGVAVVVVADGDAAVARRRIGHALEAQGVSVASLEIVADAGLLSHPYPLRGDLREAAFAAHPR